jgi:hypothetical protein
MCPGTIRGPEHATYERAQTQPVDVLGKAVPALVTIAVAQNEPRDWCFTDSDMPVGAVDQPATCSLKVTVEVDNVGFDGFDRIRSGLDALEVTVRARED